MDLGFTIAPEWGQDRRIDFPIDPEQTCAICGKFEWAWLYPLLTVPPWRPAAEFHLNWFWCVCDQCSGSVERRDMPVLIQKRREGDDVDASPEYVTEILEAFYAFRSGERIARPEALTSRPSLTPDAA